MTPTIGDRVLTPDGMGRVVEVSPAEMHAVVILTGGARKLYPVTALKLRNEGEPS